jgi:hypothetical protein
MPALTVGAIPSVRSSMRFRTTWPAIALAVLSAWSLAACGGGSDTFSDASGDGARESSNPDSGEGGSTHNDAARDSRADVLMESSTDGGDLGGHAAADLASAGAVSASAKYTLYWTLGEGPGGNNTARSKKYELRGGVVGATQNP